MSTLLGIAGGWLFAALLVALSFVAGWRLCACRWDSLVEWSMLGRFQVTYYPDRSVEVRDTRTLEAIRGPSVGACLFRLYHRRDPRRGGGCAT